MQAFRDEKTDLSKEAYYCYGCCKAFLGRPREQSCPGYFTDDGEWVEATDRFTIAYVCDDKPPCTPALELKDNFDVGTLATLLRHGLHFYNDRNGVQQRIQKSAAWHCDNCENVWPISDYGEQRAEQRAVRCCQ